MVYLAKAMIVAMVLITFCNVVLRYGFNSGIIWSEEVSLLLAVWFIFIAMGLGVKQGLHINISLFDAAKIPVWFDRGMHRLRDLVVIIVGIVMLRYGWVLVQFTMTSIMPATKLPAGLLYAVLPVSAIVILYESLTNFFNIDTNDEAVDAFLMGKGSFSAAMGEKHD
jgi:TRAP-type C4-dicarboxylate transport system permease small subunit